MLLLFIGDIVICLEFISKLEIKLVLFLFSNACNYAQEKKALFGIDIIAKGSEHTGY